MFRVSYWFRDICPLDDCVQHVDIEASSESSARYRFRLTHDEEIVSIRRVDGQG